MNRKSVFIGLLMLSLMIFMGASLTHAAIFDVDIGDRRPPCGDYDSTAIGFVDCNTTGTGGFLVTAVTNISVGDTVRWTMRATPNSVASQAALNSYVAAPCGTGDNLI